MIILYLCINNLHDNDLQFLRYRVWQTELGNMGHFLPFYLPPPLKPPKIRILKKWKKLLYVSSFYVCVLKIMIRWCTVPEIWCVTDGRTDGRKRWHIGVGAPHKNGRCTKRNFGQIENLRSEFICYLDASNVPAGNYMFKVNNRNTRRRCEIYLKICLFLLLTLKIFHTLF